MKKKASGRKKDKTPNTLINIPFFFFDSSISLIITAISAYGKILSVIFPTSNYYLLLFFLNFEISKWLSSVYIFVDLRHTVVSVERFEAMAATMMRKEAANVTGMEAQMKNEVEFAKCECCGLTEECTEAYIARVRERNQGRWICGLCAEAVKDEMVRSSSPERRIGRDEALNRHMTFCKKFRAKSLPPNPTGELISAVKQLMLKSLDSPPRSNSMSRGGLVRSQSCFSAIDT